MILMHFWKIMKIASLTATLTQNDSSVPGSNHSQSLMTSNFAVLWPTEPKFLALKDLNPFSTVFKIQEAGSILKVDIVKMTTFA